ncbi:MAG: diguanylate cyclase response regulator [Desulfuromonas sp.]|nr:MAG: diguanylate cyclase response regulator [Desulfuromonas sp.]
MARTLLIIDDSKTIRQQIQEILQNGLLFQTILQAEDGLKGLKILVEQDVDVILCDVEMPGIDGMKFLAMLQSKEDLRDKPVIMLTSHNDIASKVKSLESGASDYITKPFENTELVARLRVHLELKALQDELKESNRLLRELAQTDPLTHLYNRRHLMNALEPELNRTRRMRSHCTLILADIDHFKRVNDRYGHQMGDEILVGVAGLFAKQSRQYDIAARYGGEEFCLVLPETTLEEGREVAERIRVQTEELRFAGEAEELRMTMSFGVACYTARLDETLDGLISRADKALYQAKSNGRNCVLCAR